MTATPFTEKYRTVEQVQGLPRMDMVHNANLDDLRHSQFHDFLGYRARFASAVGYHSGEAMLVQVPNTVEQGDWIMVDGNDYTGSLATGDVTGMIVGVCMGTADLTVNTSTDPDRSPFFAWIAVKGRVAAKVEAGFAEGTNVTTTAVSGTAGAGGTAIPGAYTRSAVATVEDTPATPENIPALSVGYAEMELNG